MSRMSTKFNVFLKLCCMKFDNQMMIFGFETCLQYLKNYSFIKDNYFTQKASASIPLIPFGLINFNRVPLFTLLQFI